MVIIELQILSVLRALAEIAGMFILAQGLLFMLAGGSREKNIIFQLFRIITRPAMLATRFITPKMIADKYIPFAAFFLLLLLWIFLAYVRQVVCELNGLVCV
ncbi:hypothetical protein [Propionivibrio sp.]|uniref:hypothetical protein n=1 Tax=Propionivibrio sp. TaxID=2212460 RepID=UPI003BF250CB